MSGVRLVPIRPRWYLLAGALLVGVASLGLRLVFLGDAPIYLDEWPHALAARSVATLGAPTLPSGLVYERGMVASYAMGLGLRLFGESEFGLRFPGVVAGVVTVLVAAVWAYSRVGAAVAVPVAIILATSAWEIFFSRYARMYIYVQSLLLVSIVLWDFASDECRSHRRIWLMSLSIIAAVLAVFSHQQGVFVLPILIGITVIRRLRLPFREWPTRCMALAPELMWIVLVVTAIFVRLFLVGIVFETRGGGTGVSLDQSFSLLQFPPDASKLRFFWSVFPHAMIFALVVTVGLLGARDAIAKSAMPALGVAVVLVLGMAVIESKTQPRGMFIVYPYAVIFVTAVVSRTVAVSLGVSSFSGFGSVLQSILGGVLTIMICGWLLRVDLGSTVAAYQFTPGDRPHRLWGATSTIAPRVDERALARFVSENFLPSDVVVATSTMAVRYYGSEAFDKVLWLRQVDFESYVTGHPDGKQLSVFDGAETVRSLEALLDVIEISRRTWLVVGRISKLDRATRMWLMDRTASYQSGGTGEVFLFAGGGSIKGM